MRAGDVIQRLLSNRDPEKDSYMKIAAALGYRSVSGVTNLLTRDDVCVSTLYKICKYFGYVIVVMNPKDATGKSDMVISMKHHPLPLVNDKGERVKGRPRKRKIRYSTKKDKYRGTRPASGKAAVLNSCRVQKKKEESDKATEVLKHEDQGSTF